LVSGEGNAGQSQEYRTLFPRLIADWREKWGQGEFPFLFVQVAPYQNLPPAIREAQLLSWQKTPNTAMAVITDVVMQRIFILDRRNPWVRGWLGSARYSLWRKIEYSGPVFDALKIDGGRAVLALNISERSSGKRWRSQGVHGCWRGQEIRRGEGRDQRRHGSGIKRGSADACCRAVWLGECP